MLPLFFFHTLRVLILWRRYDQLTQRSSALREELHTELERMLNEIIRFKIHVQSSLEGYEEFVAQEVEREFEDVGAGAQAEDGVLEGEDEHEVQRDGYEEEMEVDE